jgi:hypothetical protein
MPSTYSPNLRIELIATGEQPGTWGVTTNTNLGTLIEDAVAGYVSVSITSANQALTANNGTADQSRNMVINLTTTTLANFNVYVPPAEKVYIIRNSSVYQATIFCSTVIGNTTAAGTGTAIPAGRETIVFSDGTNVNFGLDYASTLALGTALPATSGGTGQSSYAIGDILFANTTTSLSKLADIATGNALISGGVGVAPSYGKIGLATHVSGTLPVANGGTGITSFGAGVATFLGTPSSANLAAAVTGETGSGALVFATSPTLVTPALGTPSSGNLANCTFPTLNQNTTGTAAGLSATLVATSGGTGQSSYAVGDLLFASTTTALSKLADIATGNALISGGVGVAPSYGKIGLTTHVSGTLPIANGGTGSTSTTFVNLATNVSGTLPVARGGTGITSFGAGVATFLGTPSSANLAAAVTNETGSGALVFATSPTLVTPLLGTPTSGNLANCTFPTLNQNTTGSAATLTTARTILTNLASTSSASFDGSANITPGVTGTLPVARGGTGITSFGAGIATFLGTPSSANLAAAVTNETGSGALVFATSPTLVTPALGTPSSGNLANCTFPTLNQNTTGSAATVTGNATGSTFGFNSGYGSVATAFGCRAWVNFDGTSNSANLTGTYSQTGTTVTVTATAHGLITGNIAFLSFTSGTAVNGQYTVTVTGVNTFTVTQASRTTSGNVTLRRNPIRASGNVSSVSDTGTGNYTVNFTTAMPDANYTVNVSGGNSQYILGSAVNNNTTTSCNITSAYPNGTGGKVDIDTGSIHAAIIR